MQLGSVVYSSNPPMGSSGPFSGAINGVSQNPAGKVVLGNDAGGTLATLVSNREIPMAGFSILFSGSGNTAAGVVTIKEDALIAGNTPDLLVKHSDNTEAGRIRFLGNVGGDAGSIFMGRLAGDGDTIAGSSMYFGWRTGELCFPSLGSTAFGYEALRLVQGANNHAFGNQALHNITTGANNLGIGKNGVLNADVLSQGIYIGNFCGPAVWGGRACDNNTFVGFGSGEAAGAVAFTATQNCFFGSNVAQAAAGGYVNNNCIFGYNSFNTGTMGSNNNLFGANIVVGANISNSGAFGQGITISVSNVNAIGRTDQNTVIGQTSVTVDPGSRLVSGGSFGLPIFTSAVSTGMDGTSFTGIFTAGGLTVTVPAPNSGISGRVYCIVNQGAAGTLSQNYQTFAGAASAVIAANAALWIQSNGTLYYRIV
jgi:hypothetical protein